MIDTHCHLNDKQFDDDLDDVIKNFLTAGVETAICVGCDKESNQKAKEIAQGFKNIYYTIGYHPDDCDKYDESEMIAYLNSKDKKLVAIGEIGLDYFHNKLNKDEQKHVFERQIQLAKEYKLPFVVHCRDAYGDTLEILTKNQPYENGFVMHCYSGSWEYAQQLLKLGAKFSFTGTVTYKNAKNVQEVATNLPLGSFFFETDSPYLTPTPFRGNRNEPKFVRETMNFVANLREMNPVVLERETDKVAKKFFQLN